MNNRLIYRNINRSMNRQNRTIINVVGTGTVFVSPNIVVITIDITTKGQSPNEINLVNNKKVNRVLESLKKIGVQPKDIKSQHQIIAPKMDEKGEIIDYYSTTFITVTFYDLAAIGEFYYNIKADDVKVIQIILTTQNIQEYYYNALEKAVKSTYKKAKILAENMRGHLIPNPSEITETSSIINMLEDVIIREVNTLEDISLNTVVIPATVEAKFIVEDYQVN